MIKDIPTVCDRAAKCSAQGYKVSWNGYKLQLDTADCGVPIAALLSSASMHDSLAAIPLSLISAARSNARLKDGFGASHPMVKAGARRAVPR